MCRTSGCTCLAWPSMLLLYWFKILMQWWTSNLISVFHFWLSSFVGSIALPVIFVFIAKISCLWKCVFRGFFHGYSFITVLMIFNHALRSIMYPLFIIKLSMAVCLLCIFPIMFYLIAYICFLCSGIAVSMVMKYADNIVKVRHGITTLILVKYSLKYFYMLLYNGL